MLNSSSGNSSIKKSVLFSLFGCSVTNSSIVFDITFSVVDSTADCSTTGASNDSELLTTACSTTGASTDSKLLVTACSTTGASTDSQLLVTTGSSTTVVSTTSSTTGAAADSSTTGADADSDSKLLETGAVVSSLTSKSIVVD